MFMQRINSELTDLISQISFIINRLKSANIKNPRGFTSDYVTIHKSIEDTIRILEDTADFASKVIQENIPLTSQDVVEWLMNVPQIKKVSVLHNMYFLNHSDFRGKCISVFECFTNLKLGEFVIEHRMFEQKELVGLLESALQAIKKGTWGIKFG